MCSTAYAVQTGSMVAGRGRRALSLAHLSLIDCPPQQFMRIAGQTGFDLVDLRLAPATPTDRIYMPDELPALCRALRPIMEETGLGVWDVEIIRIKDHTNPEDYLALMEAAAILGARRMKLVCDCEDLGRVAEIVGHLCDLAVPFGLVMDLEYMIFSALKNLRSATELATAIGKPNLSILVDALHWVRAGDMAELASVPQSLLGYVQLCDGPLKGPAERQALIEEARTNRLAPGDGEFPLDQLLRAMPPDCVASVEVPRPAGHEPRSHVQRLLAATRLLLKRHETGAAV